MVGTSQKWPAKAGGRSPKGPAVAGTTVLAGLPGFARDSCSIIMSICAFHFYIIYFHFFSADHGIPQTFDYILTT